MAKEEQDSTLWKLISGEDPTKPVLVDSSEAFGVESMAVGTPNRVRRPDTNEVLRVLGIEQRHNGCPVCGVARKRQALVLEDGLSVFWCCDCEKYIFFHRKGGGE